MALVVFLRGVNVGGHRRFRPTTLAARLKHLDVVNIGAAGTFVVRQPMRRAELRGELAQRLPFNTEIAICEGRDIVRVLSSGVFADHPTQPDIVRFVSVLSRRCRAAPSMPISFPATGKWLVKLLARDKHFVLGMYRRHLKTIGYLGRLDQVFGVPVTTRNWNTVMAIANVLEQERSET